jgi:hypothetical protein
MRHHDMPRRQCRTKILDDLQKRIVIRNKDLNVIAHLRDLGRRADKIRYRTRSAVPNKNLKSFPAQVLSDPASDDAETDYSNVFLRSPGHVMFCAALGRNPEPTRVKSNFATSNPEVAILRSPSEKRAKDPCLRAKVDLKFLQRDATFL